jgi:hypothetical protein
MTPTDSVRGKWAAKASTGLTLGIGLALVIALATANFGSHSRDIPKVIVGTKDLVYYYRGAKKEDAIALGKALKEIGFLNDSGAGVVLAKGRNGTVVSFVLSNGGWDRPDAISNFGEIGRRIAPSVGGFPFRVWLVDQKLVIRKDLAIGKETIGMRDTVYYYGSATSQEAVALGQSLRSAGAMKDVGATVVLAKGDVTTVSFVVRQTPWESPEAVAAFESLMRRVAPSVGGLPLKLRFLDPGGVMHKEVSIL